MNMNKTETLSMDEMNEVVGGRGYMYGIYITQPGDTARSIALKFKANKVLLMQLNNMEGLEVPLPAGMRLLIAT